MRSSGTRGGPNSATMREASLSQPVAASVPTRRGFLPISRPNSPASQRTEIVSGPVTLSGFVGGVALPDHVDVAHRDVDLVAVPHLAGDVVEHAVAHVDGVVEPEEPPRRAVQA